MLEGLNTIDWKSRNAEQVPVWIRGLASADSHIRHQAFNSFETHVVFGNHDFEEVNMGWGLSDIFQTDTPLLTVPFLIELLNSDQVLEKEDVLYFLHRMAGYVEFNYEGDIYLESARLVRLAIWEGLNVYLCLLKHPEPMVRIGTIELLAKFHEYSRRVYTSVINHLKSETHTQTLIIALWELSLNLIEGIQLPSEALNEYKDLLQSFLMPDHSDPVRLVAAIFFIEHFGHTLVPEAISTVREVMRRDPNQWAEPYDTLSCQSSLYPFWSKVSALVAAL